MKIDNHIKSITIGSFDGLHLAHQELISQADMVIVIERNGGYLTPGHKRAEYTDKPITIFHFDKIKSLSPEAFIQKLQDDFPKLEKIVIGYDFHFGREKGGNAALLKDLFPGEVVIVEKVCVEDIAIHSKTIKLYLRQGKIELANKLLGREYLMEGSVVQGQGIGGQRLVPTVNLEVDHYQLPMEGVYATRTQLEGIWLPSVSFIGHRQSTDGSFAIETHILDREIAIHEEDISLKFVSFLRANRKFASFDELKQQIQQDIEQSRRIVT